MPKVFTSEKQKIGEMGENLAERFLVKHGFSVLDRNYTKKWGELDIVIEKDNKIHFIEVKSVSYETLKDVFISSLHKYDDVSYETSDNIDSYRPEDNMHPWKMKRMSRTIQTYLLDRRIDEDKDWQVDLLIVYLDMNNKKAKIKVVKDIIL